MNIKILVACHRPEKVWEDDIFMPIQVGKKNARIDLGMQGDDTGDNISEKNDRYCELTALYWAWKNLKGVDYVGLCHYRRYFDFYRQSDRFFPVHSLLPEETEAYRFTASADRIMSELRGKDMIAAKKLQLPYLLALDYCYNHVSDDFKVLESVIEEQYPEYIIAFRKVLWQGNTLSPFNMFITRWEVLDDYCRWLFPLLQEVERRIDVSHYSPFQKRVFGFMGERLLNVYMAARQLNAAALPVLWITPDKELHPVLPYLLGRVKNRIALYFGRRKTFE